MACLATDIIHVWLDLRQIWSMYDLTCDSHAQGKSSHCACVICTCVTWLIRIHLWNDSYILARSSPIAYPQTVTHCNTLQHTATHCNTLSRTTTHCRTLQHTATHCNTLPRTATHYNTLQHTTAHRSTLEHTAAHCNTPPHTSTYCPIETCGVPIDSQKPKMYF